MLPNVGLNNPTMSIALPHALFLLSEVGRNAATAKRVRAMV